MYPSKPSPRSDPRRNPQRGFPQSAVAFLHSAVPPVAHVFSSAAQQQQQNVTNARETCEALRRVRDLVKTVDNTFTSMLDDQEIQNSSKMDVEQVLAARERARAAYGLSTEESETAVSPTDAETSAVLVSPTRQARLRVQSITAQGAMFVHVPPTSPQPLCGPRTVESPRSSAVSPDESSGNDCAKSNTTTPSSSSGALQPAKPHVDLFQIDEGHSKRSMRHRARAAPPSTSPQSQKRHDGSQQPASLHEHPPQDTVSAYHAHLEQLLRETDRTQQRSGDLVIDVANVEELLQKLVDMQQEQSKTVAAAGGAAHQPGKRGGFVSSHIASSSTSLSEVHFKQVRDAVGRLCDTARSVFHAVETTVEQLACMKEELEARDVAVGPIQSMLRMSKEELLFARQQRDEAKRELMLHRVCSRWRRLVRQGREMRGEDYGLISSATQLLSSTGGTRSSRGDADVQKGPPVASVAPAQTLQPATSGGNVQNPHSAVAGLTPALRLQGAAMARNAFRTVPPRKGASAGDVERAESELTHCIANVDVIFATVVHVAIGDYDALWAQFPYTMKAAVRMFNNVVDEVAGRFIEGSALVYRSRGGVASAPHGGYHLLLFRNPHDAVHFSTMLHMALLLAPWPRQILELGHEPQHHSSSDASSNRQYPEAGMRDGSASSATKRSGTIQYDDLAEVNEDQPPLEASSAVCTVSSRGDDGKHSASLPYDVKSGAHTVLYDPEHCLHTIELQRPLDRWAAHHGEVAGPTTSSSRVAPPRVHIPPRSRVDILIKEIEEFQLQRQLVGTTASASPNAAAGGPNPGGYAVLYQDALTVAERLSSHAAIGPARVHALLDQPILFRGLRAKIGMHTGIVFVEGSVRDSKPSAPDEDVEPEDVAYSFRPLFGRSSMQTGTSRGGGGRRGSATAAFTSESTAAAGSEADRIENDAFFGTANAKVPLVYGAAVMKAAVLCGTASGGETVVSQQSFRVICGAVDAWGLFARPVAYPCASQLFSTSVPIVNDLRYTLFEIGEACYQVLPMRLAQRALFFPEDGAVGLYNSTWWLPFNAASSITSADRRGDVRSEGNAALVGLMDVAGSTGPMSLFGERTSPAHVDFLTSRLRQLESSIGAYKTFAINAAERARQGRQLRERVEQQEMEKHDAPAMLHMISTMCALSIMTTTGPAEGDDGRPQRSPRNHSGHSPHGHNSIHLDMSPIRASIADVMHSLLTRVAATNTNGGALLHPMEPDAPLHYSEVMSAASPAHALIEHLSMDALSHDVCTLERVRGAVDEVSDWLATTAPTAAGQPSATAFLPGRRHTQTTVVDHVGHHRRSQPAGTDATVSHIAEASATFIVHSFAFSAKRLMWAQEQTTCADATAAAPPEAALRGMRCLVQCLDAQIDGLWRSFDGFAASTTLRPKTSSAACSGGPCPLGSGTPLRLAAHVAAMFAVRSVCAFALAQANATTTSSRDEEAGIQDSHKKRQVVCLHPTITSWNLFVRQLLWGLGGRASSVVKLLQETLPISASTWLCGRSTLVIDDFNELQDIVLGSIYAADRAQRHHCKVTVVPRSDERQTQVSVAEGRTSPVSALGPRRAVSPTAVMHDTEGGDTPPLIDDKLLEGETRTVGSTTFADLHCWAHPHPLTQWERVTEFVQIISAASPATTVDHSHHHPSGATKAPYYIGLTFYCEEPEFPFGQIRNQHAAADDSSLHAAPLVRRAARHVLEHVRALYSTARESCAYFLPSLGFVEGDARPKGGTTSTGASTVPTITVLFPDIHRGEDLGSVNHRSRLMTGGGTGLQAHGASSVVSAHTMPVEEILWRASMSPLSSKGPPQSLGMWTTSHVESWGLSIALAVASLHDLKGACGFISPWTVFVPQGALSSSHSGGDGLGPAAYVMEGANFMLWKVGSASRNAGHDWCASSTKDHTHGESNSAAFPPQVTEWLPPEVLAWAASLSEDGENTSQYVSDMVAKVVACAPGGTVPRGPFEEPLDGRAMDVWMLGMFLWFTATGGVSPFTGLKGYVPQRAGSHGPTSVSSSSPGAQQDRHRQEHETVITRKRCEELLTCMHRDESSHAPLRTATSPPLHPTAASNHVAVGRLSPTAAGGLSLNTSSMAAAVSPLSQPSLAAISSSFTSLAVGELQRQSSRMDAAALNRSTSAVSPPLTLSADGGTAATRRSTTVGGNVRGEISSNNMFGTVGCLVRNLRICLETKIARRLAPYRASLLWPTAAQRFTRRSTNSSVDDGAARTSSSFASSALHTTSFVLLCDLLHGMLQVDPLHRLTMHEVLRHPFFAQVPTRVASDGKITVGMAEFVSLHQPDGIGADNVVVSEEPHDVAAPRILLTRQLISSETCSPTNVVEEELNATKIPWESPSSLEDVCLRDGPLFQVLPASFCTGVPFLPTTGGTTSLRSNNVAEGGDQQPDVQLDAMLDRNTVEWNTSQVTQTVGASLSAARISSDALVGALLELKHRRGIALLPVEKDSVSRARRLAACAAARRHGLTEDGTQHNDVGFPVGVEFGPTILELLGLPQVVKTNAS